MMQIYSIIVLSNLQLFFYCPLMLQVSKKVLLSKTAFAILLLEEWCKKIIILLYYYSEDTTWLFDPYYYYVEYC